MGKSRSFYENNPFFLWEKAVLSMGKSRSCSISLRKRLLRRRALSKRLSRFISETVLTNNSEKLLLKKIYPQNLYNF